MLGLLRRSGQRVFAVVYNIGGAAVILLTMAYSSCPERAVQTPLTAPE